MLSKTGDLDKIVIERPTSAKGIEKQDLLIRVQNHWEFLKDCTSQSKEQPNTIILLIYKPKKDPHYDSIGLVENARCWDGCFFVYDAENDKLYIEHHPGKYNRAELSKKLVENAKKLGWY